MINSDVLCKMRDEGAIPGCVLNDKSRGEGMNGASIHQSVANICHAIPH